MEIKKQLEELANNTKDGGIDRGQFGTACCLLGDIISGRVSPQQLSIPGSCSLGQIKAYQEAYKKQIEPLTKSTKSTLKQIGKALVVGGSAIATHRGPLDKQAIGLIEELHKASKAITSK